MEEFPDTCTSPNQYKALLEEVERIKQQLHESTSQLKRNEAMLSDYQHEIEDLQKSKHVEKAKYETKIANMEEDLTNLRLSCSESKNQLEMDLIDKEREVLKLTEMIELLKKIAPEEHNDTLQHDEILLLKDENLNLRKECEELIETFNELQGRYGKLEKEFERHIEENAMLEELLKEKRLQLQEKEALIQKLNDELLCANSELSSLKNKPLNEDSKGNSLFAEVDDKRVELQKKLLYLKTGYEDMKNRCSEMTKTISQLRRQNVEICNNWKRDLEEIDEDKQMVAETEANQIKPLKQLIEQLHKELSEKQTLPIEGLQAQFAFLQKMVAQKSEEIREWERKLMNKSLNECILSRSLAQAKKEIRRWKAEAYGNKQLSGENTNDGSDEEFSGHDVKNIQQNKTLRVSTSTQTLSNSNIETVLCPKSANMQDPLKPLEVNENACPTSSENYKKSVKFSQDTKETSFGHVRRGTRIFMLKKN